MSQSPLPGATEHLRIAMVMIDGVGDVSVPDLSDKTPLQLAYLPFLDSIAGVTPYLCYSRVICTKNSDDVGQ